MGIHPRTNYIIVNGTRFDLTSSSKLVGSISVGTHVTGYALNYHDDTYADVMELYAQLEIVKISGIVTDITSSTITIDGKVYNITSISKIPSGLVIGDTVVGTAQPSWFSSSSSIITLSIISPTSTNTIIPSNTPIPTKKIVTPASTPSPTPMEDKIKSIEIDGIQYQVLQSDYDKYGLNYSMYIENNAIISQEEIYIENETSLLMKILYTIFGILFFFLILGLLSIKKFEGKLIRTTSELNTFNIMSDNGDINEFRYGAKYVEFVSKYTNQYLKGLALFKKVFVINSQNK